MSLPPAFSYPLFRGHLIPTGVYDISCPVGYKLQVATFSVWAKPGLTPANMSCALFDAYDETLCVNLTLPNTFSSEGDWISERDLKVVSKLADIDSAIVFGLALVVDDVADVAVDGFAFSGVGDYSDSPLYLPSRVTG